MPNPLVKVIEAMNENTNISLEGQKLLEELRSADHLYCSSYGEGVDYFGVCEMDDYGKQNYRAVVTSRTVIEELCSRGFLEPKEIIPSLAGTIDQIWDIKSTTQ